MVVVEVFDSAPEKDFAFVDALTVDEEELSPALAARRHIRYIDDDAEMQDVAGPSSHNLPRRDSTYSIHSLSSVRSGQRAINPSLALPVAYRTLSHTIDDARNTAISKANDMREKAAIGM
jgi:sodium/potassium-transporting ATPase subunit alpha